MNLWIVAYDIKETKVRSRVSSILKDYGQRVQYSVFECWLTSRQLRDLRVRIKEEIEPDDQVRWYSLCSWCASRITWQGIGKLTEDTKYSMI